MMEKEARNKYKQSRAAANKIHEHLFSKGVNHKRFIDIMAHHYNQYGNGSKIIKLV
jgi:hypothetical protein